MRPRTIPFIHSFIHSFAHTENTVGACSMPDRKGQRLPCLVNECTKLGRPHRKDAECSPCGGRGRHLAGLSQRKERASWCRYRQHGQPSPGAQGLRTAEPRWKRRCAKRRSRPTERTAGKRRPLLCVQATVVGRQAAARAEVTTPQGGEEGLPWMTGPA